MLTTFLALFAHTNAYNYRPRNSHPICSFLVISVRLCSHIFTSVQNKHVTTNCVWLIFCHPFLPLRAAKYHSTDVNDTNTRFCVVDNINAVATSHRNANSTVRHSSVCTFVRRSTDKAIAFVRLAWRHVGTIVCAVFVVVVVCVCISAGSVVQHPRYITFIVAHMQIHLRCVDVYVDTIDTGSERCACT